MVSSAAISGLVRPWAARRAISSSRSVSCVGGSPRAGVITPGQSRARRRIREAAEKEEREFYYRRANEQWLRDLAPLGTNENKEYLEIAPWLIVVFKLVKTDEGGQVYYPNESVGIAVGMLLTSLHVAGLATLTHTPSPMRFLNQILDRPSDEEPIMVVAVGWPAPDAGVPDITKKPLDDVLMWR